MAFNLYCNGTPRVFDYKKKDDQIQERQSYTVEELFRNGTVCVYLQQTVLKYIILTANERFEVLKVTLKW